MITNIGLVVGPFVGAGFLVAGLLMRRRPNGSAPAALLALGGLVFLAAEVYGLVVLRPFVGRPYDEAWHAQVATVEGLAMAGLALCAVAAVGLALRKA